MINIKNKASIAKMAEAGRLLAEIFQDVALLIKPGTSTLEIDSFVAEQLKKRDLVSSMLGYNGYRHVTCISVNSEVVHGVPSAKVVLRKGDLVKVDACAAYKGYCADMARAFFVDEVPSAQAQKLVEVAWLALQKGIEQARPGNRLSDISAAIQQEVEQHGFGVVRDFTGHGIGKDMHEDPEILNYGQPGKGPVLRPGMAFALEPMITMGSYKVRVLQDGWTVVTDDGSLAAHVEDTVVITEQEPLVITRIGGMRV